MSSEPSYIIEANIRRYQRLLAKPDLPAATRRVVAKLLEEARESLGASATNERDADLYWELPPFRLRRL
jgi:hypothetical protein